MTAIRVFVVMILVTAIENEPLAVVAAFHCLMIATRQPNGAIHMHFLIVVFLEIARRRNDKTKTVINKILNIHNHKSVKSRSA